MRNRARWIALLALLWVDWSGLGARTPFIVDDASIATISVAQLPSEAREILRLIAAGGPFRYARDGAPFGNREHRLPPRRYGYYREYTVPTPGARDRGARRIIAGANREFYYTEDHYRRFKRIVE